MPVTCDVEGCNKPAVLKRPKSGHAMCKECFFTAFEYEIHATIVKEKLFKKGDKVAIGASGGKDSTVLAYIMKLLNDRYKYGLELFLLSIDEGITGYRDDSLETVKQNRDDYKLPLKILSYKDLYGWTMDEIVAQIGDKNNCTFCGTFRRQALDRGAALLGANMIVTGHNADDIAETVIMNILRGDYARLSRCTNIITQGEGSIPRCKPLKYAYEKEIVMYAHFKKLVYFSTECKYAPNAYRGHTREFIKKMERVRSSSILNIIHSGENMKMKDSVKFPERRICTRCGFVASQEICKACVLLEGLNTGNPKLGIGKSNRAKRVMGLKVNDGSENKPKTRTEKGVSKKKLRRDMKRKEQQNRDIPTYSSKTLMEKPTCQESCTLESSIQSIAVDRNKVFSEGSSCKCSKALTKCNSKVTRGCYMEEESDAFSDEEDIGIFKSLMTTKHLDNVNKEKSEIEEPISNTNSELMPPTVNKSDDTKFEAIHSENKILDLTKRLNDLATLESQNHLINTEFESSSLNKNQSVERTEVVELQPSESANNLHELREQPTIIKATPTKKAPSLILPEMMHKATNKLDF